MAIQSKSISKLIVLKQKVSEAFTTAALVGGTNILATTTGTLEVFDENGNSMGFIALFDTANLL